MSKRKILTVSIIGALVVAIAFGAVAYGSARAAGIISTAADTADDIQARGGRGFEGVSDEDLAEALGITVEELTAARERKTFLDAQQPDLGEALHGPQRRLPGPVDDRVQIRGHDIRVKLSLRGS